MMHVERAGERDRELVERALERADELLSAAVAARGGLRAWRQARLQRLLRARTGTGLVVALTDRVLRPSSPQAAVAALAAVAAGDLSGLSPADAAALRLAARAGTSAPRLVAALARARLSLETSPYVAAAAAWHLRPALVRMHRAGRRPNLNVLGEAILGWEEAERRTATLEALLRRRDVDCVSVKISSIAPGRSLVDVDGSLERAAAPLRRLYRAAATTRPHKLVTLDMEEHRDLELTTAVFCRTLEEPAFGDLTAGIALQAYLPETHSALDDLLAFAARRREAGGAPIRIRLVKGANLAMERIEAELRGWPSPVFATKAETDASYVALLERLVAARAEGLVHLGVGSHNLFDLALALVLAERAGAQVEIEMLAGMAEDQADVLAERQGRILLYVPITSRHERHNAIAYLARRLDENATPEGFLRNALDLAPDSPAWQAQKARFEAAVAMRHGLDTTPRQRQDRTSERAVSANGATFANEPDTDLTVPANRRFALAALAAGHRRPPPPSNVADVESAVARARQGVARLEALGYGGRRRLLLAAAAEMATGRKDAIAAMVSETGKTFEEADPEVSEAVDDARWYAHGIGLLEALSCGLESEPLGIVVVAPPWNFPYAIPAGGVLAALAAGNAVIVKPSPEARAVAALLVEQVLRAGFPPEALQLVAAPDDEAGERLVSHRDVGAVILTGSYETALQFARWAPRRRLLAETSGKNSLVVSATADVDLAVHDLVRSAFGHAGQKCSAASLAIVDTSIHDAGPFLAQLADATRSLRVGPAADPATEVGPVVGPITPALERALGSLEPGESWLVEPRRLGERLFAPGVRVGVRPGSWTHRTEWFGPVLGVLRAEGLEEATRWQNAVDFGLTAGLHALDPDEQRRWLDLVEAGNCYLNRPTTGAIVGRQPFGGWKRSSLGPTAKTGGPNYLLGLRRWRDRAATTPDAARASYERAWRTEFSRPVELAGFAGEANELRYRPFLPGIVVRIGPDAAPGSLANAAAAATRTGTPVRFSSPEPLEAPPGVAVEIETADGLAARLSKERPGRLRVLGQSEAGVLEAAADAGVTVLEEPIVAEGRVELARWLREQSISRTLHRYGSIVYSRLDLG